MQNTLFKKLSQDYEMVEQAIAYIENNLDNQPPLSEIAASVHLSDFHFQKIFSRWVGISPKRFLQFLTKEHAKKLLSESKSILDATYDSGLSSPGRLHDLFVNCEAVTPGEYKVRGEGITITYGISFSPFGKVLVASTDRGICTLKFVRDNSDSYLDSWVQQMWPKACIKRADSVSDQLVEQVFSFETMDSAAPLHLYIKGTNFQIKVWEALLKIPFGKAVTYQDIASFIGDSKACRAVGTAVGKNPIPFLIPCHRVIRKMGDFGNYGEGPLRKKALLGWEFSKSIENSFLRSK